MVQNSILIGYLNGPYFTVQTQGPEEMCLSLEHQNPSKTSEKKGLF